MNLFSDEEQQVYDIEKQVCDVDTPECYILCWASALHLDDDHILQR